MVGATKGPVIARRKTMSIYFGVHENLTASVVKTLFRLFYTTYLSNLNKLVILLSS